MNVYQEGRKYRSVGGSYNRPAQAPRRAPRRVKTPPSPAVPCRVVNAGGEYYDYDTQNKTLFINLNLPDGHLFPSRHKANNAIWHTIQKWIEEDKKWDKKEFTIENVR